MRATRKEKKLSEKETASMMAEIISDNLIRIAKEKGIKDTVRMLEAGMMAASLEEMEEMEINRGRYAQAARSLHVHINTFRSRLEVLEPEIKKMTRSLRTFKKTSEDMV